MQPCAQRSVSIPASHPIKHLLLLLPAVCPATEIQDVAARKAEAAQQQQAAGAEDNDMQAEGGSSAHQQQQQQQQQSAGEGGGGQQQRQGVKRPADGRAGEGQEGWREPWQGSGYGFGIAARGCPADGGQVWCGCWTGGLERGAQTHKA